jgi:hypothetical protein
MNKFSERAFKLQANIDASSDQERHSPHISPTVTGWDSYEVWRRFIKEVREKRRAQ